MNNIIKFPHSKDEKYQQELNNASNASRSTMGNIVNGVIGALYIVLVIHRTPVRLLLIANVVLQFFKMLFKWHEKPFVAAWPFVLSFVALAVLTYTMAT